MLSLIRIAPRDVSAATTWRGYAVAVAVTLLALAVTLMLQWATGREVFLLFVPAIMAAAWYGGLGAGLVAAIGAVALRIGVITGVPADFADVVRLGVAAAVAIATSAMTVAVRRQRNDAQRAREHLSATLDALPALVSYVDRDLRYQFVNGRYQEWFGRPRQQFVGRTLIEVLGPAAFERIRPYVDQALRGESCQIRQEIPYAVGGTRIVDLTYVPDRGGDGHVRGFFALVRDVTDEARAAEAVRLAESKATATFRTMADHAPALIWMSDTTKAGTWFNRPWLAFTGRALEQEVGDGWLDGVHPDDRPRLDACRQAFESRTPFVVEFRLRRHDGEYRWVVDTGVPIFENGDFTGFIGSCFDITDRRLAEQERDQLLQKAETANRLKDEFLATLSHELRTPLNTVLGWTHVLRDGAHSEKEMRNALDIIERNIRVQTKLVDDALDVSRIVSGKLRLELQTVDIANVVQGAVAVLQPTADAKGVALSVDVRHGHGFVAGDPSRLHQAIWNVVANGIKFTRKGGSVAVRVKRRRGHVDVSVADSGIGIAPEFLPHVFERFRQAEGGYAREFGGLGLGLAIVRHLVELHGGSVAVASPGRDLGSTFTLSLPLVAAHPSEPLESPASADQTRIDDVRVLVVDDDDDARSLVVHVLEGAGAVVTGATSAAEALAALDRERFDVLLSDLGMPVQDGCDLIRAVRQRPAEAGGEIPAAALTAYARSEDRTRVLKAGFQLHVAKPLDPGELLAVVQTLANQRAIAE